MSCSLFQAALLLGLTLHPHHHLALTLAGRLLTSLRAGRGTLTLGRSVSLPTGSCQSFVPMALTQLHGTHQSIFISREAVRLMGTGLLFSFPDYNTAPGT